MKKLLSLLLCAMLLSGTMLSLASCGDKEPVDGGAQISVYLGNPIYDFDPQGEYTNDGALSVLSLMFEPLFRLDGDGDLVNGVAKSYSINEKTGVITVKLRETYWSDGITRVTASDFVYSWQRLIRQDSSNPAATLLFDIKNAVAVKRGDVSLDEFGVKALNNSTLQITLEEGVTSYKAFLRNLTNIALAPLNANAVGQRDDFWAKRLSTFSCNGPFKLGDYSISDGIFTLERNNGYHRPAKSDATSDAYVTPNMLKTLWNVNPEITDAEYLESLLSGLVEKTCFYVGEIPLSKRSEADVKTSDLLSTYSYLFNTTNPLFSNPEVRRILASVIDREAIIRMIVYGEAATGLVPSGVSNGSKLSSNFRKNGGSLLSTTATMTVAEARTALGAISGYVPGEFNLTYYDSEEDAAIATYIKGLWEQLGYTVNLAPVSGVTVEYSDGGVVYELYDSALQIAYESGNFDVIGIDYQMYSANPLSAFAQFTSNLNGNGTDLGEGEGIDPENPPSYLPLGNVLGYKSDAYDAKVAAALAERDLGARAALLHEAEEILLSDMPIIPLVFNQSCYASSGLSKIRVDYNGYAVFTKVYQKNYTKYLPKEEAPDAE